MLLYEIQKTFSKIKIDHSWSFADKTRKDIHVLYYLIQVC